MKFDLHIHSVYSDGVGSPGKILSHASKINLDGISITDHDTMKGYLKARALAKKFDIILVPGVEITSRLGDILAFGIEEIPKGEPIEIIDKIRSSGGIIVAAHPFGGYEEECLIDMKSIKNRLDAIEVFNANTPLDRNKMAMELAEKMSLPGIAGSDSHFLKTIGSAFTISEEDILTAIRKGKINIGWNSL